ncbi:MAG TPA: hypothetical protein VGQ09_11805 [Chitinophagaceae bacterium]|nr:hypothetical protein [Chitinophagaceae bacterium]
MKLIFIALGLLLLTTSSCKKSEKEVQSNKICFSRTLTELKIENNTDKKIYFVAFGQNVLPLIDWIPTCGDNNVSANSSMQKDLTTITGYLNNNLLVVYWWECTGNNPGQIQNVTLDKNQSVCQ